MFIDGVCELAKLAGHVAVALRAICYLAWILIVSWRAA
jgi:hypothetical protein